MDWLFSIQHIWGSSDHVEVAFSKTEETVHYDGKLKDLSVGANSYDYTITLMSEGYEDLVVNVDNKPVIALSALALLSGMFMAFFVLAKSIFIIKSISKIKRTYTCNFLKSCAEVALIRKTYFKSKRLVFF